MIIHWTDWQPEPYPDIKDKEMSKCITIPFMEDFRDRMLNGQKIATSSAGGNDMKGKPCPYKKMLCQTRNKCSECPVYQEWQKRKVKV